MLADVINPVWIAFSGLCLKCLEPRRALLLSFDQLNEEVQQKAVDYVDDLVLTGRYKKCAASGLGTKEA